MGGIVAALLVAGVVAGVIVRQRSHDDVHSVEHYHRKLHTLEEIRAHPSTAGGPANGDGGTTGNGSSNGDATANGANGSGTESGGSAAGDAAYPASAVRIAASGSSAVRLTDPSQGPPTVPPAASPPLVNPSEPVQFDDPGPEPIPSSFMQRNDRAMEAINHRPRRLGGPLAAVAAVTVLVIILIVTGLHSNTPASHSGHPARTATTVATTAQPHAHAHASVAHGHRPAATTTTAPPVVSAPTSSSAQAATYTVGSANYALALSATVGECWVQATDATTGAVLFSGTLFSGHSHTVSATGPVTVVTGAPSAFAATVNGVAVTLPQGYQAPLTLKFETPQGSG